jgi:hypothetical protein
MFSNVLREDILGKDHAYAWAPISSTNMDYASRIRARELERARES